MKKTDLRVVKTTKAINSVFFELLEEVGFEKITVKEIIERALINRSTFYAHYIDKYDLLNQVEDELLKGLAKISDDIPPNELFTRYDDYLIQSVGRFVQYAHDNGKMFTLLIGEKGDPMFGNKLAAAIRATWDQKNIPQRLTVSSDLAIAALVGMMTGLIVEWVKSDFRQPPEEFTAIVVKILRGMLPAFLNPT